LRILLSFVVLAGCLGQERIDAARDRDGDGYEAWQLGGEDCDDSEPAVHPGANEICADEVDNDCDGITDDDGIGASTWYPDLDGDGFGADAPVTACAQPDQYVADLDGGTDCNDSDSSIKPGATEVWYDGVDQDCDGADDFDQDRDGYRSEAETADGTDCDDLEAEVNPGEEEVCGNHRDDDCDGGPNACELRGTYVVSTMADITIKDAFGRLKETFSVGDATGDGKVDLLVGGYTSTVFLFQGPMVGVIDSSSATATFNRDSWAWRSGTIAGDFNGDGVTDVALGSDGPEWGVHVFFGPVAGTYWYDDADLPITTDDQGYFGWKVAALPDQDGDNKDELLVGSLGFNAGPGDVQPEVFVFSAPWASVGTDDDCVARLFSVDYLDGTGKTVSIADLDEDGFDELIISSNGEEDYAGSVAILDTPVSGEVNIKAGTRVVSESNDQAGWRTAAGDLDGDTHPDLLITAIKHDSYHGRAYVARGPFTGVRSLSSADTIIEPGADPAISQFGLEGVTGDLNGDGTPDIAISAHYDDAEDGEIGVVFVFYGPIAAGTMDTDDANVVLYGEADHSIRSGALFADVNADGFDDLVLGANGYRTFVVFGDGG